MGTQNKKKRIQYIAKDTLPGKLFLYELNTRNLSEIENSELLTASYYWFKDNLIILSPDSKVIGLEIHFRQNEDLFNKFTGYLDYFDTGISDMEIAEVQIEKVKENLPKDLFNKILEDLKNKEKVIINAPDSIRYAIELENDEIHSYKIMTKHKKKETGDVLFELSEESDGTQRLFDLIPGLMSMQKSDNVFIIDELDRSLHPILSRKFLELFFKISKGNTTQLITCTHESILLDQKLLRKDEIWFIEKNNYGESKMYSLEEFNPRYDKDIQKGYLLGRFGAIAAVQEKKLKGWI